MVRRRAKGVGGGLRVFEDGCGVRGRVEGV